MNKIIKARRKELRVTLEEIGDYVGVSKATVQRWETGGISSMRQDRIKRLSEILQIDPKLLIDDGKDEPPPKNVKVPVLGRVAAGIPISAIEDIIDYEEVPLEWTLAGDIFALQIKGDSMEPRILEGDVVIVRKQSDVNSGEIAILLVGENDATCKKVIKHNGEILLVSNNPKYSSAFFSKEDVLQKPLTIIGKVIELRAKF
ncbi:MAG: S24 family peptidase [Oscillospiraceae bacterium]